MFRSVLIANRGEIACRIIRSARAMGLRTIAVYSLADRHALHVEMADEAVPLGGMLASESYLNSTAVIDAARATGAECIHPGYGFLAENAEFAEACAEQGITFVGPPIRAIRAMGRKDDAKALAREAGVPVLPGYDGDFAAVEALVSAITEIGFPVMVKAVAGGGGTGMRRVGDPKALPDAIDAARREAMSSFGDARLIIEKCLDRPRHIEVQVFADNHGNCVHMFERDCSLQRRRQKVIEEAPAPGMTQGLRNRMTQAAVSAARTVGYSGAGTVEFLVEAEPLTDESDFYFLEMNTRLQVEHPVTEAITGLDLVEWQFRVAAGEPLGFAQEDIRLDGHAVEARVYCEDPVHGFLPSSGKLALVRWPAGEGVRADAGVRSGDVVSPYYDPMLAKLICHGADREQAVTGLREALSKTAIAGPRTNLAFLYDLLGENEVASGRVDTGLIERMDYGAAGTAPEPGAIAAGVEAVLQRRSANSALESAGEGDGIQSPWARSDGFLLGARQPVPMRFSVDGQNVDVGVTYHADGVDVELPAVEGNSESPAAIEVVGAEGGRIYVLYGLRQIEIALADADTAAEAAAGGDGAIRAPMHGRISAIKAAKGDHIEEGMALVMLEAMKMEHRLVAPMTGRIAEIAVTEGQQVGSGDLIAIVEAEEGA